MAYTEPTAYAARTEPIRPDAVYPLDAWTRFTGVSKSRQREARQMGLPLPTFALGKRLYVRGHEGIAWMEELSSRTAEAQAPATL